MAEYHQELVNHTLMLLQDDVVQFSSNEEFRKYVVNFINRLINEDFNHLLFILYRIDVHEDKVRHLLDIHQGENAAEIITDLIIERQIQKIATRQQFKSQQNIVEEDGCDVW